ncbi:GIN domain-containing protein [Parvularcula oceani]|uniref:GIN domain-containing protein n=1 Tax=Parvularcula oceani TaxID=1247963 RepID=UPI0004E1468C|nr:DUF2807 domain-containing protein [Parvularcula oceani]
MTTRLAVLLASPLLLSLSGCIVVVDGQGPASFRTDFQSGRAGPPSPAEAVLEDIEGLQASAGTDVRVRSGGETRIVLDERAQERTTYAVEDGILEVTCRKPCGRGDRGVATVYVQDLSSLRASSGASIRVEDALPAAQRLSVRASSGGSLDARRIEASRAEARASSGGSVRLTVTDRLDASASSGGSVSYWGDPSVDRSTSSGGSVSRRGGA